MSLILDSGAFIALERGNRSVWRKIEIARRAGILITTHGGIIAQVWRGGTRGQVQLTRALRMVKIVPLDDVLGRQAGMLLAHCGLSDAIDAALVAMANHGDEIITSDPQDIQILVASSKRNLEIIPV